MKKKILVITGTITGVSVLCAFFFVFRYYHSSDINKEYQVVEDLVLDIKEERTTVKKKLKQLEEIKMKKHEKVSILEVWQEEKEKVEDQN